MWLATKRMKHSIAWCTPTTDSFHGKSPFSFLVILQALPRQHGACVVVGTILSMITFDCQMWVWVYHSLVEVSTATTRFSTNQCTSHWPSIFRWIHYLKFQKLNGKYLVGCKHVPQGARRKEKTFSSISWMLGNNKPKNDPQGQLYPPKISQLP
jgi:hypothetical protein